MHFEFYCDRWLLMQSAVSFYIAWILKRWGFGTATPTRMLAGILCGDMVSVSCLLLPLNMRFRLLSGSILGGIIFLCITFWKEGAGQLAAVIRRSLVVSFFLGGGIIAFIRLMNTAFSVSVGWKEGLLAGGVESVFLSCILRRRPVEAGEGVAVLCTGASRLRVHALVDTGNSLTEPISKEPVCVVDRQVLEALRGLDTTYYRVVPYSSVGEQKGIMKAFLLPELILTIDQKKFRIEDVYIAVSPNRIPRMLIHPELLEGQKYMRDMKGLYGSERKEYKDDNEGYDTCVTAVLHQEKRKSVWQKKGRNSLHRGDGCTASTTGGGSGITGH